MNSTAIFALLLLVAVVAEASPRRGGLSDGLVDALVEANAVVEWFVEDNDFDGTCAASAASAELNEITIEKEEGGRRRGPPSFMREARKAACKDAEDGDEICLCARVTGDDDLESEFALTCGTCEFGLIPDDIGEDKDEVDDVIDDLEDALGIDSSEENDSKENDSKENDSKENDS